MIEMRPFTLYMPSEDGLLTISSEISNHVQYGLVTGDPGAWARVFLFVVLCGEEYSALKAQTTRDSFSYPIPWVIA
jgi:hypothetical protein